MPSSLSYWSVENNEACFKGELNLDQASYQPVQDFNLDYRAYCNLLGIQLHPKMVSHSHSNEEEEELQNQGSVYIRNWQVDVPTLHALFYALPHSCHLTTLGFFNAQLTLTQIEMLAEKLPNTFITKLQLEWNPLGEDISQEDIGQNEKKPFSYANFINENSKLQHLSLRANSIASHRAFEKFALALSINTKLKTLNLYGNQLGDQEAKHLSFALHHNGTLEYLSVANNNISDIGGLQLIQALTRYQLEPIDFDTIAQAEHKIQIELEAAKKKKKKMDRGTLLQEMKIRIPTTQVEGDETFGIGNGTLQTLILSSNNISQDGFQTMNQLLKEHSTHLGENFKAVKMERSP